MSCNCNCKNSKVGVKFARIHKNALLPAYAREGDAGFDFFALMEDQPIVIPPNTFGFLVKTGLKVWLPKNYELQVRDKSGMCVKTRIRVSNSPGTIDEGFKGEIQIIIDNFSDKPYIISNENRKIAQGVVKYVPPVKIEEISEEEINARETERGEGGFGSTGLSHE